MPLTGMKVLVSGSEYRWLSYSRACQSFCVLYTSPFPENPKHFAEESMRNREIRCCPDCHRIGKNVKLDVLSFDCPFCIVSTNLDSAVPFFSDNYFSWFESWFCHTYLSVIKAWFSYYRLIFHYISGWEGYINCLLIKGHFPWIFIHHCACNWSGTFWE